MKKTKVYSVSFFWMSVISKIIIEKSEENISDIKKKKSLPKLLLIKEQRKKTFLYFSLRIWNRKDDFLKQDRSWTHLYLSSWMIIDFLRDANPQFTDWSTFDKAEVLLWGMAFIWMTCLDDQQLCYIIFFVAISKKKSRFL